MSCKKYKSCKNVPCGETQYKCPPEYCFNKKNLNQLSRNWGICNTKKYKDTKFCKNENKNKCKLNKTNKITKNTIGPDELYKKFPYIWRYLKPNTRKHIIKLANKPIKEININYMLWDDKPKRYLRNKYQDI
jgi:hypothetical protein